MASSSSYDHNKSYLYDVFLSFCGEDTRNNFVDHLYAALDQQGICTFKDDERLEKGRGISDDLLQSIEESRFYIIVFSKGYASSSWCLNELLKIMECHNTKQHTAFPVFYDVDPSEVRKQSGLVGDALAKQNRNESKVKKWREALTEASNLCGWDVRKTANGHEAKIIKLIVHKVTSKLLLTDLNIDENLVGMEKRMKDLDSCLEIGSNDVRMIGIKGMGGAGKTTLARAIFDKISSNFEGASFVENVRERTSQSGLKKLQTQVLRDVLKDNNIYVNGVHEGKYLIKKKLRGKKVLIVLDDVDSGEQLEELAGDPNWFKPGSRVIITTRDEQVLNIYTVKWIINVNLLSDEEAIRLFSRYAFRRNIPSQEYETQSCEVLGYAFVRYAAGLPLTIKVLGSFLCGKNKPEWIDAISRLKTIPLKEIHKKLELSYESLEDDYKEMFLHVACLLKLWEKEDAIRLLESCGFHARNGLKVLQQKSLITINEQNQIQMHDHIEEMGKNIVRREHQEEPHKHSRLCVHEEIEHVMANNLVTIPLKETIMILEIRCDSMENGYKEIFLDVASFDNNRNIYKAIRMLESCGYHARNGMKVQQKNMFISNELILTQMHDCKEEKKNGFDKFLFPKTLLISFQKNIVHREHQEEFDIFLFPKTSLISFQKNIVHREHQEEPHKRSQKIRQLRVLAKIEHVLAIYFDNEETSCNYINNRDGIILKNLRKMKKLRCLVAHDKMKLNPIIGDFREYIPNKLESLSILINSISCFPKIFEASNLVTLKMPHSKIQQLWKVVKIDSRREMMNVGENRAQNGVLDCPESKNEEKLLSVGRLDLSRNHFYYFLELFRTRSIADDILSIKTPISSQQKLWIVPGIISTSSDRCFNRRTSSD